MDAPPVKEKRISVVYDMNSQKRSFNPIMVGDDIALTKVKADKFKSTREELIESITSPSRQNFIINNAVVAINLSKELNFENEIAIKTSFKIIEECASQNKMDLITSKTSQGELLFFTKKNGVYNNILIDEDGDISYLRVGKTKEDTKTAFFSNDGSLSFSKIVSLL